LFLGGAAVDVTGLALCGVESLPFCGDGVFDLPSLLSFELRFTLLPFLHFNTALSVFLVAFFYEKLRDQNIGCVSLFF